MPVFIPTEARSALHKTETLVRVVPMVVQQKFVRRFPEISISFSNLVLCVY
jgi:hypothetical protein